jgi:hypothetical protein
MCAGAFFTRAMSSQATKASTGRRVLVILLGVLFFGLSLCLPFVPVGDNVVQVVCRWAVNIGFFIGSIILIYAGVRGQRNQVAKALEAILKGL